MNKTSAQALSRSHFEAWPSLPLDAWKDTYHLLHRCMQIAGKIKLALAPMMNHWWQTALYVTPRGLTTSPIPYGTRSFAIDFDLVEHSLRIETNGGSIGTIDLRSRSVAQIYGDLFAALRRMGLFVEIWPVPVEVDERTPFNEDRKRSYDPEYARSFLQVLVEADRVLKSFRSRFRGKASPVHFFWGSFDLAVTRFSGRAAPMHPGAPNVAKRVMVEAYNSELSSCGFWPGEYLGEPAFYSYAYPEPDGFRDYPIQPREAFYHEELKEFVLPYEVMRKASSPDDVLINFLQSTYEAAANLGDWDRQTLESTGLVLAPGAEKGTENIGGPSRPR